MRSEIAIDQVPTLPRSFQRKGDEDGAGVGQRLVLIEIGGVGVELEGDGVVSAGGACSCEGEGGGAEEGDEEVAGPSGA